MNTNTQEDGNKELRFTKTSAASFDGEKKDKFVSDEYGQSPPPNTLIIKLLNEAYNTGIQHSIETVNSLDTNEPSETHIFEAIIERLSQLKKPS